MANLDLSAIEELSLSILRRHLSDWLTIPDAGIPDVIYVSYSGMESLGEDKDEMKRLYNIPVEIRPLILDDGQVKAKNGQR